MAIIAGVAMFSSAMAAAKAEQSRVLAPSSPWDIDYGLESCTLSRIFGDGDMAISLYLTQTHPGSTFDLSLAGPALGEPRRAFGTALRFGTEERKFKDSAWIAQAADGRPVLLVRSNTFAHWDDAAKRFQPASPETLHAMDSFEFNIPKVKAFTLATGPMDKPMAALEACEDDLVKTWGFDPAQLSTLSRWPEPQSKPDTWISPDSYPQKSLNSGEGAILEFRIVVGPTGRAESCVIQNTVGDKAFAESACKQLMENARFSPALDAQGQPVRGLWFNSAHYQTSAPQELFL
jgi:hypothetical protein